MESEKLPFPSREKTRAQSKRFYNAEDDTLDFPIRKEDFKSAFRRMHLNGKTTVKSAIRIKRDGVWYLLISLLMPFGDSPCPKSPGS